jgi:multidrug transporter EmrE-like cation transporter
MELSGSIGTSFHSSEAIATLFDQLALNSVKAEANPLITAGLGAMAYVMLTSAIKAEGMAESNAYWNVLSTMMGTIIGHFYWGEELGARRLLGITMGAAGIYLMDS